MTRAAFLDFLATRIAALEGPHPGRVGIDGVDGAGKTTLADALAPLVAARGRPVFRASVDDFHQPRALRYRQGKRSARGYFADSFDYRTLEAVLLTPLSPGGSRRIRRKAFDYRTDSAVDSPRETVPENAILLFDGVFLHRPELVHHWDLSIFLAASFEETVARMVRRDGAPPGVEALGNRRYVHGQQIYLEQCRPEEISDLLVDYSDFEAPRVLRDSQRASPSTTR